MRPIKTDLVLLPLSFSPCYKAQETIASILLEFMLVIVKSKSDCLNSMLLPFKDFVRLYDVNPNKFLKIPFVRAKLRIKKKKKNYECINVYNTKY